MLQINARTFAHIVSGAMQTTATKSPRLKIAPAHAAALAAPVANYAAPTDASPLPARGGDPWFHLSRSFWYALEKRGLVRLVRLRLSGNVRGRVLLRREDATAAIAALSKGTTEAIA